MKRVIILNGKRVEVEADPATGKYRVRKSWWRRLFAWIIRSKDAP